MIIEYELQGSKILHKGLFDTNGFWVRFEEEREIIQESSGKSTFGQVDGYKIYSHFSFTFEHTDKEIAKSVFNGLCLALSGADWESKEGIGFIKSID